MANSIASYAVYTLSATQSKIYQGTRLSNLIAAAKKPGSNDALSTMVFGCRWRLMAAPWETTAWSFTGAGCTSLRDNHAALPPPVYPIFRLRRRLQSVGPMAIPAPAPVLSNSLSDSARQRL